MYGEENVFPRKRPESVVIAGLLILNRAETTLDLRDRGVVISVESFETSEEYTAHESCSYVNFRLQGFGGSWCRALDLFEVKSGIPMLITTWQIAGSFSHG